MAEAARNLDHFPATSDAVASQLPGWSGEVHGPVAALHHAIEAGLTGGRLDAGAADMVTERPVDRWLRAASRLTGWAVLALAFAATAAFIF